jgi:Domain of unknown function (DUF6438)/Ankyrin repeats (many copies)
MHAFVLLIVLVFPSIVNAQGDPVITLRRTNCFGTCPNYWVEIFEDGLVKYTGTQFVQVIGERRGVIPREAVEKLVADFLRIDYFSLSDSYETYRDPKGRVWVISDLPTTYTSLRIGNRKKTVKDYAFAPDSLRELEWEIDRITNTHRWIDGDADNLRNWEFVQPDVYRRIKPGLNLLMHYAGVGDLKGMDHEYATRVDINATDQTGWTALMLASAMCQVGAVRKLLDWGARVDLEDREGDSALMGAAAAFCSPEGGRQAQVAIIQLLIQHGADPNARNRIGETPLMTVTTYGNIAALRALLNSGARPELRDQNGRSALDYARQSLKTYNDHFWTPELMQVVAVLEGRQ